jgi:hypothetical protein
MVAKKHPERVSEPLRPKFGIPAILEQSDRVAAAFGPQRGFTLMVLAIAGVTVSTVMLLLIARLFLR